MTLPAGWLEIRLGDVGDLYCGQSVSAFEVNSSGQGERYVTGPDHWDGKSVHIDKWTKYAKRIIPDGCIFITVKGAGVGKTFPGISCAIGRDIYAYHPDAEVDFEFMHYALRQRVSDILLHARGDIPGLSREHITDQVLGLPNLTEQRRIVAKLDMLTTRLTQARAELDHVVKLLAQIRSQSIITLLAPYSNSKRLGDAAIEIRYGTSKKCSYAGGNTPVLRIPNVQSGAIDLRDLKSAIFNQTELSSLSLRKGDLLVIRSNGSVSLVGRSAVVGSEAEGYLYAGYLIRVRLNLDFWNPKFVQLCLNTRSVRTYIETAAKSSSGVNNINAQQLRNIMLPKVSLRLQAEIVSTLGGIFARADRLEAEAARARALLDRLEAAILARAFQGELVPQDPDDEPASVLLDRIRARRAAAPKPPRQRRAEATSA